MPAISTIAAVTTGRPSSSLRWPRRAAGLLAAFASSALLAFTGAGINPYPTSDMGIEPTQPPGGNPGNITCQDINPSWFELKVDSSAIDGSSQTISLGGSNTVTFSADVGAGWLKSWTATVGIDAVIMKGGSEGWYVYTYAPESMGEDKNLYTPLNPGSGVPAGISHINFCFDKEVTVSKTAVPKFDRTYDWSISKTGAYAGTPDGTSAEEALIVQPGQSVLIGYTVQVGTTGFADSNYTVEGVITVTNTWDQAAKVTDVTDQIGGVDVDTLTCPSFPVTLASGESLECTYSTSRTDASSGTNVATATTDGTNHIGGASGSANFAFTTPTNLIDECVDVTDTLQGLEIDLDGSPVCVGDNDPKTFNYSRYIVQGVNETCLDSVTNTAEFFSTEPGSSKTGSATATIYLDKLFCETFDDNDGCTLTQGYWKTHSKYGPAPFDDTWNINVPKLVGLFDEDTIFFSSSKSYYAVLWTSPAGNAYYNLAHQYIAALLNKASGASSSTVDAALLTATGLFETYTPAQIAALSGNNAVRKQFLALATLLDNYNNGIVGPGHCSE